MVLIDHVMATSFIFGVITLCFIPPSISFYNEISASKKTSCKFARIRYLLKTLGPLRHAYRHSVRYTYLLSSHRR